MGVGGKGLSPPPSTATGEETSGTGGGEKYTRDRRQSDLT